jgi:translation initiation factor IF-1
MNNADTAGPNNDGTALTVSGIVVEALPDTLFKVEIKDRESDPVLAYLSGKMRLHRIRVLVGDEVEMLLDKYGGRARITRRLSGNIAKK